MMFFLGLLVGTTAGFFCAAMARAASADVAAREYAELPHLPTYLQESPTNTGRYAFINESANESRVNGSTGT